MNDDSDKYPHCFGRLDAVFPMEKEGLRTTPEACRECVHKIVCLRAAMQGVDGLKVKAEVVDRAYASGMITFMERWSKKKDLDRRIKKNTTEKQ
jgi:hypothetical protein